MKTIKVYGAEWCGDTTRTRDQLDELGVPFEYIDIDENPAAEKWITQQNKGKRVTPTVDIDGKLLFEPTNEQMEKILKDASLI